MSTTIDERVVEMRFDNKQFESGVQTTMSTLDKLKQSLKLTGASEGLENVQAAAGRLDLSCIGNAAETVGLKFNAMYTIADQALRNIVNSAMVTGKKVANALTIEPIKTGFQEYETQINAVQTILANTESKGTTIKDVNAALDELNTYADKTIYNFTQMTRNIGTFTAAGVDLDKSVTSIKGIANLAAVSGSTSQQASTAMYQLSQALAAGKVSLMDWNSVVNAGMGGQVFQDALKRTAKNMGHDVDALIKKYGSFRESLTQGEWLTADVLTETLTQLSGAYSKADLIAQGYSDSQADEIMKLAKTAEDAATKVKTFTQLIDTTKEALQSGWTQSWEIIVGDFEEAKKLFTEVSDTLGEIINKSAEERNTLLQGWKDAGGRNDLVESLRNAFEGVVSIITPIKEAFREIFPPITVEQLTAFTKGIKNLTDKLVLSDTVSDNVKRTFKGLFAALDICVQVVSVLFKAVSPLIKVLGWVGFYILEATAYIGDWLVKADEFIKKTDFFNQALEGIVNFFKLVGNGVKDFIVTLGEKFGFKGLEAFHSFLELIQNRMSSLGEIAAGLGAIIVELLKGTGDSLKESSFLKFMSGLWNAISTFASGIGKAFGAIFDGLANVLSNTDFSGVMDLFNAISLGGIAAFVLKFVNSFSDAVEVIDDFKEGAIGILESVRGCFEAYQSTLKAATLLAIASAIGILATSILILSLIDSKKLAGAIAGLTTLMATLMGSFKLFTMINSGAAEVGKACTAMISMSVAILILAAALKTIGDLKFTQILSGVTGIAGLAIIMVGVAEILGNSKKTIIKGASQMVVFAVAIKVLASACKDLAVLKWEELAKGLIGVGVLMGAVSAFLSFTDFDANTTSAAVGILIISAAMKVLASACADFGKMDWDEIAKGLVSIGALLAEFAIFARFTGNSANLISTATALAIVGAAMKILAYTLKDYGNMQWEKIGRGLLAMAGSLLAVTLAVRAMPNDMVIIGTGLIAVSTALIILSKALESMAKMSWQEIGKGLVVLGGSIAILAAGLRVMKGTLDGSAALLVATAALLVLAPALSLLGAMKWSSIIKGLVTIAAALTILGIAGYVLQGAVPAIVGIASAIALIGAGIFATGKGLIAFGLGLTAIAAGFVALSGSATAVVSALKIIVIGVLDLVPSIIEKLGDMAVAFFDAITEAAPAFGEACKALVTAAVDAILKCSATIAEGIYELILTSIQLLGEYTPQIVEALADWFIGALEKLGDVIPEIVQTGFDVMTSFYEGVNKALGSADKDLLMDGFVNSAKLGAILANFAGMAYIAPLALAGMIEVGLVIKALDILLNDLNAMKDVGTLDWLGNEGAELLRNLGTALGSFYGGVASGIVGALSGVLPKVGKDLSEFMTNAQPFIEGVKNVNAKTLAGALVMAEVVAVFAIAEMLSGIANIINLGGTLAQIGKDLSEFMTNVQPFMEGAQKITPEILKGVYALTGVIMLLTGTGIIEGISSWITGKSSIATFGEQLPEFGKNINDFATNLGTFDDAKVTTVECAVKAIKAMAEGARSIPNQGGWLAAIVGDNTLSQFGQQLPLLGSRLKLFAANLGTFDETDASTIDYAAKAIKAIADVANTLPDQGGWLAAIVGDNTLSQFGQQLPLLGSRLKLFADNLGEFDEKKVTTIKCASDAIKAMADVANTLPNEGGWLAAIVGDNSISTFGGYLPDLGTNLSDFATNLGTFDEAKVNTVTCAANAIKSLADTAEMLPNEGGWISAIVGDNSISTFGGYLPELGTNLGEFATNLGTFDEAKVNTVTCAANAIKSLANAAKGINGQSEWSKKLFGDDGIGVFSSQMPVVGANLNAFATNLGEFDETKSATVACAVDAIKGMANAAKGINGQSEWAKVLFGDDGLAAFSEQMPELGTNLSSFATNLGTFDDSMVATISCACEAIKNIASAAEDIDGQSDWAKTIFGDDSLADFGEQMPDLGTNLSSFATNLGTFDDDKVKSINSAMDAINSLAELADTDLKSANKHMSDFGENIVDLAEDIADFCEDMPDGVDVSSAVTSLDRVISAYNAISDSKSEAAKSFSEALKDLGKNGVSTFVNAFNSSESKTNAYNAAKELLQEAVDGIDAKEPEFEKAAKEVAGSGVSAIKEQYDSFYTAGSYLVDGLKNGISENSYKAAAQAAAMATAAKEAAEEALDINSPSKVFYGIGRFSVMGLVNALVDYGKNAYRAGSEMAEQAKNGLSNALSKVSDLVNSSMDTQPTIRPVLDLSDVEAGAGTINGLFSNNASVGVLANVGNISSMMNRNSQNGSNEEVVSAINKLRRDLGNVGNTTYNVNGVTYDDGSNVSEAVKSLVRAAKIERRV